MVYSYMPLTIFLTVVQNVRYDTPSYDMVHGGFYQVAHRHGTSPVSPDPAFRLLRFIQQPSSYDKGKAFLTNKMGTDHGDIIFATHGTPLLIRDGGPQIDDPIRTSQIIKAHCDACVLRENEFQERRRLMLDEQRDAANALEDEARARHNARGWVKYCKTVYNVDDEVLEGAEIERPVIEDEFEEPAPDVALPSGVVSSREAWAAVSWIVSDDDTMDTVLYVHAVYADDDEEIVDKVKNIFTDQLPVDVIKVGEWIRPVHYLWHNTPTERTWGDDAINEFQDGRRAYKRETRVKQREMQRNQAMRESTVLRLCEASGLSRDEVDVITKGQEGMNALHHAIGLSDSVCREEELERVREIYLIS